MPGAIYRALARLGRMKGQGGVTVHDCPRARISQAGQGYILPGDSLLVHVLRPGRSRARPAPPHHPYPVSKSLGHRHSPRRPASNVSRNNPRRGGARRPSEDRPCRDGRVRPRAHGLNLRSASEEVDRGRAGGRHRRDRDLAAAVMAYTAGPPECLVDAPDRPPPAWRDWADPIPTR